MILVPFFPIEWVPVPVPMGRKKSLAMKSYQLIHMMKDEAVITTFLDDILSDVDFEENGSRGVNIDYSTPIKSEDTLSDMDSSTSIEYSTTMVITLTMIKTETALRWYQRCCLEYRYLPLK